MRAVISAIGQRYYMANWLMEANPEIELLLINAEKLKGTPPPEARFTQAPYAADAEAFLEFAIGVISRFHPDLLISLDSEESLLWANALEDSGYNPSCLFPDKHSLLTSRDKATYPNFFDDPSVSIGTAAASISDLTEVTQPQQYLLKKSIGSGSRGQKRITGKELLELGRKEFNALIRQGYLIQPEIKGIEFGIDIFCRNRGVVETVNVRKKLRYGTSETLLAEIQDSRPFYVFCSHLAESMGLLGVSDLDVILSEDGKIHLLDVNSRFGGGYPFSHLAGGNILGLMVEIALHPNATALPKSHCRTGSVIEKLRLDNEFRFVMHPR